MDDARARVHRAGSPRRATRRPATCRSPRELAGVTGGTGALGGWLVQPQWSPPGTGGGSGSKEGAVGGWLVQPQWSPPGPAEADSGAGTLLYLKTTP